MSKTISFRPDADTAALIISAPGSTTAEKLRNLINTQRDTARQIVALNHSIITLAQRLDKMPSTVPQTASDTPRGDYVTVAEFRGTLSLIAQSLGFLLAAVESPASINREGYKAALYQLQKTIKNGGK